MNTASNPDSQLPVFVDEVDQVFEFSDRCPEKIDLASPATPDGARPPTLTDEVNQLVEFTDEVAARQPVLVDEVDALVEFSEVLAAPVSSPLGARVSEKRPLSETTRETKMGRESIRSIPDAFCLVSGRHVCLYTCSSASPE